MTLPPRCVTIFVSCPGDLVDAKAAVVEAAREVGRLFATYGLQVKSWCHETDGRPALSTDGQAVVNEQASADYNIYIGLMCRRLGTPTPRAPSGTLEEFLEAQRRFIETGKPDILFYFCDHSVEPQTESERSQLEKVHAFRKSYPGLFATFHTTEEVKALVKHHLIDLLLREGQQKSVRKRAWALWLAQRLDHMARPSYLDRSSAYVVRSMGKLGALLNLSSLLSDPEYEALLAAQYIRALRLCEKDMSPVNAKINDSFPTAFDWEGAVLVADLADVDAAPVGEPQISSGLRCGFLAALLCLGDALDLDHAAITAANGSPRSPTDDSPIEHWVAYLTRRVEVSRTGSVAFHLGVPLAQRTHASNLRRSVALMFEARWQRLRIMLTTHGVAVARLPMQSAPSSQIAIIPDGILAGLGRATTQAEGMIRDLQHFGQEPTCPATLENLLPLPYGAIAGPLRFKFNPDLNHRLHLRKENETAARELVMNQPGEILMDTVLLSPPGARYRWSLQRDDGDFFSEVSAGLVWQIPPADQTRLSAGGLFSEPRYAILLSLGLNNDLLRELWPRLVSGETSLAEYACVYDTILAADEWLQANAPESGQVELIRNFGNWIHKEIVNKKGNQL